MTITAIMGTVAWNLRIRFPLTCFITIALLRMVAAGQDPGQINAIRQSTMASSGKLWKTGASY